MPKERGSRRPSRFAANGAWLAIQVMAHNLARWTARIGLGEQVVTTKTLRRRFFSLDRTPHPLGAPPHFASAPALALGSRVQWRPGTIARPAISCLTAARLPLTRHPANCTSPPTRANPVREGHSLPTAYRIMSAIATAGRHQRVWVPTSRRPHPHLLESGLAPSPSLTHHPWCQRQCPSLRWIRGK